MSELASAQELDLLGPHFQADPQRVYEELRAAGARAGTCSPRPTRARMLAATRCWPGGRPRCTAGAYGSSEPRTASSDSPAITTAALARS